jgi:hypothetical protein
MIYGYARVSTDGQTLEGQQAALRSAGCERIYAEKESGAKSNRAQLAKAIAALAAGDTLACPLHLLARLNGTSDQRSGTPGHGPWHDIEQRAKGLRPAMHATPGLGRRAPASGSWCPHSFRSHAAITRAGARRGFGEQALRQS